MWTEWLKRRRRPNRHSIFSKSAGRSVYWEDIHSEYNEDNEAEGRAERCETESESEGEGEKLPNTNKMQEIFKQAATSKKRKHIHPSVMKSASKKRALTSNFGLFSAVSPMQPKNSEEGGSRLTIRGLGDLDDGFPVFGEEDEDQGITTADVVEDPAESPAARFDASPQVSLPTDIDAATAEPSGNPETHNYPPDLMGEDHGSDVGHTSRDRAINPFTAILERRAKFRRPPSNVSLEHPDSSQSLMTDAERKAVNSVAATTPAGQLKAVLDEILQACPECAQVERENVSIAQLHCHAQIQLIERLDKQCSPGDVDAEEFEPAAEGSEGLRGPGDKKRLQQSGRRADRPTTRARTKALQDALLAKGTNGGSSGRSRRVAVVVRRD